MTPRVIAGKIGRDYLCTGLRGRSDSDRLGSVWAVPFLYRPFLFLPFSFPSAFSFAFIGFTSPSFRANC